MKFRLLAGKHVEGKEVERDENGVLVVVKKSRVYRQGDVIETDNDLTRLNSGAAKFERLDDAVPATPDPDGGPPPARLSTGELRLSAGGADQSVLKEGEAPPDPHYPVSETKRVLTPYDPKKGIKPKSALKADEQAKEGVKKTSRPDDAAPLEEMTVPELKELAAAEEIDLEGAHLKADIVERLKKSGL